MKRVLLFFILVSLPLHMSAQLKSIKVYHQADTLILNTSNSSIGEDLFVDLFKGPQGFCLKRLFTYHYNSASTNNSYADKISFFSNPTFYLGDTAEGATDALKELLELSKCDVATHAIIIDFKENEFYAYSATGIHVERKTTRTDGDRLLIKNDEMEEPIILLRKTIEDAIKYLTK